MSIDVDIPSPLVISPGIFVMAYSLVHNQHHLSGGGRASHNGHDGRGHSRSSHSPHGNRSRVRRARTTSLQARTVAKSILALVHLGLAALGPDIHILNIYISAGNLRRTEDLDRRTSRPVRARALPVRKREVLVLHAAAGSRGLAGPEGVQVQRVGVCVADKVQELCVLERAGAAVGLDHHHLVGVLRVDVAVDYVFDVWLTC
jgi:hypothetical protein